MEQDFGFYEGKAVFAGPQKGGTISGKEAHGALHKDDAGFVDVESKEAMALRADAFLDEHLLPLMDENNVIAVVSHGIMLSSLWRRFLRRLTAKSVTIHPDVIAMHGQLDLERPGGWSNTGYMELEMSLVALSPKAGPSNDVSESPSSSHPFAAWTTTIRAVNHKAHLNNLKRTRGGVGSSRHDEKQKSIVSFFKKQKR